MSYITLSDYALSVSHEELSDVLQQAADGYGLSEEATRLLSESKAEAKIKNFLSSRFDLQSELAKVGAARNMELVGVYVDLTLCSIYRSVSPDDIPEMRKNDCVEAIEMLVAWRDGNMDLVGVSPPVVGDGAVTKPDYVMPVKFISKPEADPLMFDDAVALPAPTLLIEAVAATATTASLGWTSNSLANESGFEVRRSIDNINFETIVTVPRSITSYVDSTVVTATIYYYKVRALGIEDLSANSVFSNILTVTTP
jgi:hypothetical protein